MLKDDRTLLTLQNKKFGVSTIITDDNKMKKFTIIKGHLIGLLTFCFTSGFSQTATTTVNIGSTVMPNPKLLLGITYDCRSSLTLNGYGLAGYHNTDGTFRLGIDSIFNNFPMSTLRYPANGIMQGFEWKKSIGSIGTRQPQQIFSQSSNPAQVMEFGFDEFMAMSAARGTDPKDVQIMVPIYDSADVTLTPTQITASLPNVLQSNADWVEYANAPNDASNPGGGIDWAAVRAANGHPTPYGIKIWNMGNEPYTPNEYGTGGVNSYINNIVPIIDAMRAIDPSIKITVTVTGRATSMWTNTVLNSTLLQGKIYAVNAHYFMTEEVLSGGIPYGVDTIETSLSGLAAAASAKGYKLIVGDYAHAILGTNPSPAVQDLAMQWQGANLNTDFLLTMSQINNIERSDFWVYGLVTNQWHPIRQNSNGTFTLMPAAAIYKTLSPLFLDNSIAVVNTSPVASDGNPYSVRSGAFASNDLSQLNVISVNRDKLNTHILQVNGIAGYNLTNSRLLTATGLASDTIIENTVSADINGNFTMPPMSVLLLEYTNTPLGMHNLANENNQIIIYPNPFSTQTVLRTDNIFKNATVTIYNIYGQTVKQINNISGQEIILHRDNLPSGLYFVRLTEDNKVITADKLVIAD